VALVDTTAIPVAYCNKWQMAITSDLVDVTARGDTNKVRVAKRPEITGSFNGFFDQNSADTYENAVSGVSRRFYLYPTTPAPGTKPYWFGTGTFDFSAEAQVDGAVTVAASWWAETFWTVDVDGGFSDGFSDGFSKAVI